MDFLSREPRRKRVPALHPCHAIGALLAFCALFGCASPGPPRSPSLNLPQPVTDLVAARTGNVVELSFTLPRLSTDKLPLLNPRQDPHHRRSTTLRGAICRELKPATCITVATITPDLTAVDRATFTWHETLPAALATGSPRLLTYRVEFLNKEGKSAAPSNAAYTAAGTPPAPVTGLRAEGTRSGILLHWTSDSGTSDILLHRIALAPETASQGALWLNANSNESRTLDASVTANTPYRYAALRRSTFLLDKRRVELRSEASSDVDFTLHPVYAPAAPTGLEATGFAPPDNSHFAVDLIWQPISDADITPSLAAPLTGYNVYREQLNSSTATRTRLTSTPAPQPGFHDVTAEPTARYRYSVTAIDGNGNESKAATVTLEPSPQ